MALEVWEQEGKFVERKTLAGTKQGHMVLVAQDSLGVAVNQQIMGPLDSRNCMFMKSWIS